MTETEVTLQYQFYTFFLFTQHNIDNYKLTVIHLYFTLISIICETSQKSFTCFILF